MKKNHEALKISFTNTAFMAFLSEMFFQLKRRQLKWSTQCDRISPAIVLLTPLGRCCEFGTTFITMSSSTYRVQYSPSN